MKASDLREFYEAGRPLVERWLDLAEQFKCLRDAARAKEVDWAQVKQLLKAQIEDARAGTDKRVRKIIEKADCASSYADMLGLGSPEKNFSRDENVSCENNPHHEPTEPVEAVEPPSAPGQWPSDLQAPVLPEDGSIPEFLRRSA